MSDGAISPSLFPLPPPVYTRLIATATAAYNRTRSRVHFFQEAPFDRLRTACILPTAPDSLRLLSVRRWVAHYGASTGLSIAYEMLATASDIFSETAFTQGTGFSMVRAVHQILLTYVPTASLKSHV